MKKYKNSVLFWLPRILSILFAIFLSLFALDVFQEGQSLLKILITFFIYLAPTFLIILILIVSWKREWIAGLFYILLAILYLILTWINFPPRCLT